MAQTQLKKGQKESLPPRPRGSRRILPKALKDVNK
jgi:hypothetical protein